MKKTYYITFGQASFMKNGWLEILADSEDAARSFASQYPYWCGCYTEENFEPAFFLEGRIGEVVEL